MDIEKLIESVRLCGSTPKVDQCKRCAYWAAGDMSKCIPRMTTDAATALSTLQAENEKLRAESIMHHNAADNYWHELNEYRQERNEALAELEQVKAKRNAAVALVHEWEQYGRYLSPMGFTVPPNWRED